MPEPSVASVKAGARGFPAGLFFWVCSVAIVPGDYDHDQDRSGRVGAGCRQFCRMPRHGSLAMWEACVVADAMQAFWQHVGRAASQMRPKQKLEDRSAQRSLAS